MSGLAQATPLHWRLLFWCGIHHLPLDTASHMAKAQAHREETYNLPTGARESNANGSDGEPSCLEGGYKYVWIQSISVHLLGHGYSLPILLHTKFSHPCKEDILKISINQNISLKAHDRSLFCPLLYSLRHYFYFLRNSLPSHWLGKSQILFLDCLVQAEPYPSWPETVNRISEYSCVLYGRCIEY